MDKVIRIRYKQSQLFISLGILGIGVGADSRDVLLQLDEPRDEIVEFFFDIFAILEKMGQRDRGAIRWSRTSQSFMSAVIPPKNDLRGGQKSADSVAISRIISVVAITRCFVAAKSS